MEYLVVKLTGKIFNDESIELLKKYRDSLLKLVEKGYRVAVVVGGGGLARKYIEYARRLGVSSNYWLDIIGINASRLNALLLTTLLYPTTPRKPAETLEEVLENIALYNIVVLGGLIPGQSTAAVAVETAEAINAKLIINAGAIDYVYTKDPRKHPDAAPLSRVKATQLLQLIEGETLPGEYQLLDKHAVELMIRSKIKMALIHYKKPEALLEIIKGRIPGTLILPE